MKRLLGLLALVGLLAGCAAKAEQSKPGTVARALANVVVPCDTDADCEKKNPELEATPKPVNLCGAPTKAGGKCKRRVKREGATCWQHQVITEDDPRWDCRTMGNKVCGKK